MATQPGERLVIAIDGPAGAGKSTVARAVAVALGIEHLDTGAMYRIVTARALADGVAPSDGPALAAIARQTRIDLAPGGIGVDGAPAGPEIRTQAVDAAVSEVSAHAEVRAALVEQQRRIMAGADVVAEGRDIGTVVFPDAPVKIFLTASIEERARRRSGDLAAAGHAVDLDELAADIERRDRHDAGREHSPLAAAADAVHVDTTGLSIEQVVDRIASIARARTAGA